MHKMFMQTRSNVLIFCLHLIHKKFRLYIKIFFCFAFRYLHRIKILVMKPVSCWSIMGLPVKNRLVPTSWYVLTSQNICLCLYQNFVSPQDINSGKWSCPRGEQKIFFMIKTQKAVESLRTKLQLFSFFVMLVGT
jgi:hypothetical protein